MKYLLILLVIGCGSIEKIKKTHPDFKEYIEAFEADYDKKVNTPILWSETLGKKSNSYIAGVCYPRSNYVLISKETWDWLSEERKEVLIYHELGHCTLRIGGHREGTINLGIRTCPKSIMRSMLLSEKEIQDCYLPYREYYMDELFGRL